MELRHLRYFVAVAEAGSFTRAARTLDMQQPPLSQQIRDLERELGFVLFRRLPRGVELSPGGTVFVEEARAILERVTRGQHRAARAAQGTAGALSAGFTSSTVTHRFAPQLIRRFHESHPEVEVTIREGNAAALSTAVAAGRLDVAIIRRPVSEQSGLAYHTLIDEKLLVALPALHPLAVKAQKRGADGIRLRDLKNEPFILVRRPGAPGMYGDLIEACRRLGFAPKIAAEVDQMLTNITLVASGAGVSVVPASMKDIHREDVYYAEARDAPQLRAPLSLVTRLGETNPTVLHYVRFALRLGAGARAAAGSRSASAATRAACAPPSSPRSRERGQTR